MKDISEKTLDYLNKQEEKKTRLNLLREGSPDWSAFYYKDTSADKSS